MICRFLLSVIFIYLLVGCDSLEHQAWKVAESAPTNKTEIIKFLNHYKQNDNGDKYHAACYLVANMPNKYSFDKGYMNKIYDLSVINADSLISSLDYSFALRDTREYLRRFSFEDFLEYVLPYRIANEPAEYYWNRDIPRWINVDLTDSCDILPLAKQVNRKIKITTLPEAWGNPQMGYTATISGRFGKCDDRAILATMSMRSQGIPAAFEFVPNWGSNNNGHSFCSVILANDSVCVFQDVNDDGENLLFSQKVPKIYRQMFSTQNNTLVYKSKDTEPIPPLFQDYNLQDVTKRHKIGQQKVKIPVQTESPNKIAYLCVFTPQEWLPIAYGENKGRNTLFEAVGDGSNPLGFKTAKGENIGEGIVYLPAIYTDNDIEPVAHPIILSASGIRTIVPSSDTEQIRLTRKYPRFIRLIRFANEMVGGVFEGANRSDFSDAVTLYSIINTPLSRLQRIDVTINQAFKYIRYRKPQGTFSLGEMRAYDATGQLISGKLIATEAIAEEKELENICDDKPLTYYELSGCIDLWAGTEFKRPTRISQIEFCPRNDDNEITPGDEYELFYWDNIWISLGKKIATDYILEYKKVPKGALLWLRNLTKGREERPFTYENSTQVWW